MMQRLLEGEMRAASITPAELSIKGSTQASNFSLLKRSAASTVTIVVSMANCRKHSDSRMQDCGSNPTRAARAAAFRVMGVGTRAVAKALSIVEGKTPLSKIIVDAKLSGHNAPKGLDEQCRSSLLFPRPRESGHYAPKAARNEGFGATLRNSGEATGSSGGKEERRWSR